MSESKRSGKKKNAKALRTKRKTTNTQVVQRRRTLRPPRPIVTRPARSRRVPQQGRVTSTPATVGMVLPRARFSMTGKAQRLADYDADASLRLCGTDLYSDPIVAGSSDSKAGFGSTATYYAFLTPSTISSRITNVEGIFQYYAIRRLRVHYIPTVGTSTAVSLALAVVQDFEMEVAFSTPTQQQILEFNPSVLTPSWQVASVEYKHTGTKLWECYSGLDTSLPDKYQALLACTLLGAEASTTYGQLWLEYEIDFYQPSPKLPAVNRRITMDMEEKKRQSLGRPSVPDNHRAYEDRDEPEVVSPPRFRPLPSSLEPSFLRPDPPTPAKKGSSKGTPSSKE